jgi:tricorn protease
MVGHYTRPSDPGDLMDGGFLATPDLAFYSSSSSWGIENHGVSPDIEVEDDPQAARKGRDQQLEKAVEVVLDLLRKNPPPAVPQHPPFPNNSPSERRPPPES